MSAETTRSAYTESWVTGPSGIQFYTRLFSPPSGSTPRAVILFLHGHSDHIGRYGHFHPFFSERGLALFAFDQRGFGLTAQDKTGKKSPEQTYGKTTWNDQKLDIEWAIEHVGKMFEGIPLFIYGHSMGGTEALSYATQCSDRPQYKLVKGIIAASSLIAQSKPTPKIVKVLGGFASRFMPMLLIPTPVPLEELSRDPKVGVSYAEDPLVVIAGSLKYLADVLGMADELRERGHAKWPKGLPLLIIHGAADNLSSPKASEVFHDQISTTKKKLILYNDARHELHNETEDLPCQMANDIVAFIDEYLSTK